MMTDEQIKKLPNSLQKIFRNLEYRIIRRILEHVKAIGESTPYSINKLLEFRKIGTNIDAIEQEIMSTINASSIELQRVLEWAAKQEYNYVKKHSETFGIDPPDFQNNIPLQQLIERISNVTGGSFSNISGGTAIGMVDRAGNVQTLTSFYYNIIDDAILKINLGKEDFPTAMRNAIRKMADGGIRQLTWDSGYTQRIDTAVRRNILGGLATLSLQQSELIAAQLGATGMEISWHDGYRPSHDWGGLQFPMEKWRQEIKPQMQEPNCYHRSFAIFYGLSTPAHSADELAALRAKNEKKFEFEGKIFNRYTAEQRQRQYEATIRKAQDRIHAYDAVGDLDAKKLEKIKLNQLFENYKKFSKSVNLPTRSHRYTGVGGS